MKNIAVTGSSGMLGQALTRKLQQYEGLQLLLLPHSNLDIAVADTAEIKDKIRGCSHIFNCAAYTNVDKAEEEEKKAYAVNSEGVKKLSKACFETNCKLIHISTDFVFDGSYSSPITCEEKTCPHSVYGKSKVSGEINIIKSSCKYIIARTSWLFGKNSRNFVKTIFDKAKNENELRVVCDQYGRPTYAEDLADILIALYQEDVSGIFHCSNNGVASWYQFACEIIKLSGFDCQIKPVTSAEYPTPAKRPAYSVLDIAGTESIIDFKLRHWQDALKEYIDYCKKEK